MNRLAEDRPFYEQRAAEKWPTSDNPEMVSLVDRISAWCQVRDGDRVLDFGCYDGYILTKLKQRYAIDAVGVDIALSSLQGANHAGGESTAFVVADDRGLPFVEGSFDVVVCSEVLEHVNNFEGLLADLSRVMKPGGRLYATMPNDLRKVFRPLRPICKKVDHIEGHLRRMSLEELRAAADRHGWRVERSQYRGFVFSAVWYWVIIYNPRLKHKVVSVVHGEPGLVVRSVRVVAFSAMRLYLHLDHLFSRWDGCMGVDVLFVKA